MGWTHGQNEGRERKNKPVSQSKSQTSVSSAESPPPSLSPFCVGSSSSSASVSSKTTIHNRPVKSSVLQQSRSNLQFLAHPASFSFFQNSVSISDQKCLDDVETCQTLTLVRTPFEEWTNLKCNELNMKEKDWVTL